MGQNSAKQFPPPQAIGAVNRPNDILSQSIAAPTLPQNALQPLIQNQIPFMATANAVPNGTGALPNQNTMYPYTPKQYDPSNQYNSY